MKQVCSGPVENRHKIIGHYLYAKLCQISQCCLIIFNVLISSRKSHFDIIMYIHTFYHIHMESVTFNLFSHLFNLVHFPDLAWLLVMKRPYQSRHSWDLADHILSDVVISFSIPAKCHLHKLFPPFSVLMML